MKQALLVTYIGKALTVLVAFLFWVLLARVTSQVDYGQFSLFHSFVMVLATSTTVGTGWCMVRQWSGDAPCGLARQQASLTFLFTFAAAIGTVLSLLIALAFATGLDIVQSRAVPYLFMVSVLFLYAAGYAASYLLAEANIVFGRTLLTILSAGLLPNFIIMALLAFWWAADSRAAIDTLFIAVSISSVMAVAILWFLSVEVRRNLRIRLSWSWARVRTFVPQLFLASLVPVIVTINDQVDIWLVGTLGEPAEVALFNTAHKISRLASFPLIAISVFISRRLALGLSHPDTALLQRDMRFLCRLGLATSALFFALLVIGGHRGISLLFGAGYVEAHSVALILCLGQLVNVATGAVIPLLVMSNRERMVIACILSFLVLKVGLVGIVSQTTALDLLSTVAAVSAVSFALINILLVYLGARATGVVMAPFGRARKT